MQAERPVSTPAAGANCLSSFTSRFRRDVSRARVATRMRRSDLKGFSMKSYAPRLIAATAVSMLPCPEIITTGTSACSRFTCSSNCNPSSLLPCSQMSRNTRCGRRLAISARAESLSRAVRVVKPSSSRMPATRSRISASSSTIKMSFAMVTPVLSVACCGFDFCFIVSRVCRLNGSGCRSFCFGNLLLRFGFRCLARYRKPQPHPGSPRARADVGGVIEFDPAAVVFQHATDDRKPKAGALLACCDVGFEQTGPAHLWQTDAVIDDVDHDVVVVAPGDDINTTLPERLGRNGFDGFGCILNDVGQRLRNQPPVELRPQGLVLDLGFHIDLGMSDPHQEHGLPYGVGDVFTFDHRLWHPRETRELVDHTPDVIDLPHDRVHALLEDCLVLDDGLARLAPNTLGRKLDRRQRILDLVCDATGNISPRRRARRGNRFGVVVKRDDVAVARLAGLLGADAN